MQAENPLEAIRGWIIAQPSEVQSSIHFMVGMLLVDRDEVDEPDFILDPEKHFWAWVDDKINSHDESTVSAALHLRELIQYFVIDHFGKKEQWDHIASSNSSIAEQFRSQGEDPNFVETIEGVARSAPFRQRLWHRVASDWTDFISKRLTNDHIRFWQFSQDEA
jgi:hypothetical protein